MDHLQLMNGLTAHLEFLFYPSRIMQSIKSFKGKTLHFERHTGDYLEIVFEKMLTKWKISLNEVHCVVRDSGTNIKKALSLARVKNVDCFAHQTQIVVKNSIISQKCVSDLITKCRLIATHFNHSVVAQN